MNYFQKKRHFSGCGVYIKYKIKTNYEYFVTKIAFIKSSQFVFYAIMPHLLLKKALSDGYSFSPQHRVPI